MFEARSCEKSGRGLFETGGELEREIWESRDAVLPSDGTKRPWDRGTDDEDEVFGSVGGAMPFPLPRILPPPSFLPDMTTAGLLVSRSR